jgi:carboxyl-terminal processing protease
MAVLVNRYTASAGEILAACLQDHHRAVVVGERTFGRGTVQSVLALEGGKSALKLTTATFQRPSGKNIHRGPHAGADDDWGVLPDKGCEVKLSPEQTRAYFQFRRQRDVLRKEGPPPSDFEDRQLQKAIDRLLQEIGESS